MALTCSRYLALPFLGLAQVLQHLSEPLQYLAESLVQVGNFFFWRHDVSISDKGQSEQYPIVHAFGLDERTVASWRERAGQHCEQVHQALVEQG